jgi:exodeoxyribonuclease VII large subunit
LVEVNEASVRNGHLYLELSERGSAGLPIARARAMIWAGTASRILPDFEKATGAMIGAGIKLLVRAKPVFKAQYGLSLEIDAIDSEYTLGAP